MSDRSSAVSRGDGNGDTEARFIRRCLELAARARGATSPNPLVGAVVVREGVVVGSAWHHRAGEPHAERLALEQAGPQAGGATLYSNMEPCCHHGRTPPCVDAIIEAGVARVVSAIRDPDPRVDGKGFEALRAAGIEVSSGFESQEAAELNAGYLKIQRSGIPFVIGKAALSLDGRLATRTGSSQWITGEQARAMAHRIRAGVDAVVVGVGTVLADDPRLTARHGGGAGPRYRVVLDSHLRTPPQASLLQQRDGVPLIMTTQAAASGERQRLEKAGATVLVVAADGQGRVDLPAALVRLAALDVCTVMLEGGSRLLTEALQIGIIDKVFLFYAPLLIGGAEALPLWGGEGVAQMDEARRLQRVRHYRLGRDWAVEGYLRTPPEPE